MALQQAKLEAQRDTSRSDSVFDVAVVGGGVVGCAVARRFTLEGAHVALLEKAPDILDGASKANSAILHTGFDAPEGSLELQCLRAGYAEYHEIRERMGLALEETGAHVVAWNEEELGRLESLLARARANGICDARMIGAAELRAAEPNLSESALGALFVPGESIIDPWSAPYAYLRQALENGARAFRSCAVEGGAFDGETWCLDTASGQIRARVAINCAGLYGDDLDRKLLGRASFRILPRKGQFVVFDKAARGLVSSIILPVPGERTKGIVLFPTVFGNLAVGPTAEDQDSRSDTSTDAATLKALIAAGVARLPALARMPVTATYAGLRPATGTKEYRIHAIQEQNWITVGGIRSTGLTAALGIARHVFSLYGESFRGGARHGHVPLPDPVVPKATILAERGRRDWQRPGHGEIVCHCELVTRREIEAALTGALAARSLAGLKRQTRATMGRCQGFYCTARLAELTAGRFTPPLAEEIADG